MYQGRPRIHNESTYDDAVARMCLAFKGVDYETHWVKLPDIEETLNPL
jgi:hypothetical protein